MDLAKSGILRHKFISGDLITVISSHPYEQNTPRVSFGYLPEQTRNF
ncbi:hypothetical protein PROFUN_16258 [Planoprotostelium fungivorum]|uniref:Uncharacterized protein n=1 Tax=Planoprotostelium fungivorum TaxID=1890364 RepID=A0A2P6MRN7_9EUKA|nr:hypothetical protein PROFUN_16258 [Planoprotostelium fungivorum]